MAALTPSQALAIAAALGCGARTGPREPAPPVPCADDVACDDGVWCNGVEACRAGRCAPGLPVACRAAEACVEAACDESARACVRRPASADRDGDGHRAPRPGAPVACGDDCDDDDRVVHPGATEVCNGRDDDCDGAVDEGAALRATDEPVRVSDPAMTPSGPGGLAWTGSSYAAAYWSYRDSRAHGFFSRLSREGSPVAPRRHLGTQPEDFFGAALAWTGDRLGAVWQDRRDTAGGHEINFNRLTLDGEKLGPDQRVSFARGFSIHAAIAWTGESFVLAWQDERDRVGSGRYELYGQRIDVEGRLLGPDQRLTRDDATSESPAVASGPDGRVGLAWMRRGDDGRAVWFMSADAALGPAGRALRVSPPGQQAVRAALTWNADRWIVAWFDDGDASPDHEVWAAVLDRDGRLLAPARRLTVDPAFSRDPALLPFGDRFLLVWSDDREGGRYGLFAQEFSSALAPVTAATAVTRAAGPATASVYPVVTRGPEGDVGVLFRDQRDGRIETWFTRLRCPIPR